MRRELVTLTLMVIAVVTPGAWADEARSREFEEMANGMESVLTELLGVSDPRITFKDHGTGLYSLMIPLEDLEGYDLPVLQKAKDLRPMATGHQVTEPTSLETLIHAVHATVGISYNHWWAWINRGNTETRETTVTHKGPGPDFKFKGDVEYAGGMIGASWFEDEDSHPEVGEYFQKAKINKGGSKKAECFGFEE